MYNFTNDAGELLIDAAALRFEDSLDEQSARERYDEGFYADYADEPSCDTCEDDEDYAQDELGGCPDCGLGGDGDDFPQSIEYGDEDSWLDGSYEE